MDIFFEKLKGICWQLVCKVEIPTSVEISLTSLEHAPHQSLAARYGTERLVGPVGPVGWLGASKISVWFLYDFRMPPKVCKTNQMVTRVTAWLYILVGALSLWELSGVKQVQRRIQFWQYDNQLDTKWSWMQNRPSSILEWILNILYWSQSWRIFTFGGHIFGFHTPCSFPPRTGWPTFGAASVLLSQYLSLWSPRTICLKKSLFTKM